MTYRRLLEFLLLTTVLALGVHRLMGLGTTEGAEGVAVNTSLAGLTVPPVPLQPGTSEVSFSDGKTRVVLIYSPRCPACDVLRPVWRHLAEDLPATVEVLALSVSANDTTAFLPYRRIRTVRPLSLAAQRRALPHRGVPTTVVISGDGRTVLWVEATFGDDGAELIRRTVDSLLRPDTTGS